MEVAIAGAGYVGLTSAVCLCELGHRVHLVEVAPDRLTLLRRGESPIFEPGLPELLRKHHGQGLTVTDSLEEAVTAADVLFVCVGTPPRPSGAPDLHSLRRLLDTLRRIPLRPGFIVALKSTVPPGTSREAARLLPEHATVVSNPEFLREGTAIHDFFHPDRIVIGAASPTAAEQVAALYRGIDAPVLLTGWEEAELIKYASNAFLAVKLSFANEVAALADSLGADGLTVLRGVGLDRRIGPDFLAPGPGYGGSCLPKDLAALRWTARRRRVRLDLLPAAQRANRRQRERVLAKLGPVEGRQIAVWGLAFKAGTDDVRESPALEVIPALLARGARVTAHDPAARHTFAAALAAVSGGLPGRLRLVDDPWDALHGADALLVLTEWPEYAAASPEEIRTALAGDLVVDGRNLFDPEAMAAAGLRYRGIGRDRGTR